MKKALIGAVCGVAWLSGCGAIEETTTLPDSPSASASTSHAAPAPSTAVSATPSSAQSAPNAKGTPNPASYRSGTTTNPGYTLTLVSAARDEELTYYRIHYPNGYVEDCTVSASQSAQYNITVYSVSCAPVRSQMTPIAKPASGYSEFGDAKETYKTESDGYWIPDTNEIVGYRMSDADGVVMDCSRFIYSDGEPIACHVVKVRS